MPEPRAQELSPDQESRLIAERDRGEHARRIVADELFAETVAKLRRRFMDEWEVSPVRDTEGRERIYLMVKILDLLVEDLESLMMTGAHANITLAAFEEKKRERRFT